MTVPPSRQLFVGHVPPYLTEDHLITIFSRFGELEVLFRANASHRLRNGVSVIDLRH